MPVILATAATALALLSNLAPMAAPSEAAPAEVAPAEAACGATWLDLQRSDGELSIRAGFVMPIDVDTVHLRVHGLAGATGGGATAVPFEVTFDEQGVGSVWEGAATARIPGTSGGSGHLTIDSYVVLANGATCEVGGSRTTF